MRDPRKLFQIARREFPDRRDLTSARAAAALRGDVARQILAPKPRSLGKSAAEGPNDRLQADLVDFSQNTRGRNKYGLVVQDVFTREIATKALPDKRAETVTRAAAEIIPDLVQEEGNYVVTTDLGNEFQGLETALPGGAVHRQKDPTDRNATAVVDRAIQTLKKDLAGMVARRGGGWGEHVDEAAEAYNARPHQAVTVAPEDVETMPAASFRAYQDNAAKFQHNKRLTQGRQRRLRGFRRPGPSALRRTRHVPSSPSTAPRGTWHLSTPWWSAAPTAAKPCSSTLCPCRGAAPSPWPGSPGGRCPWRSDSSETSTAPLNLACSHKCKPHAKRCCNPRPKTTWFACWSCGRPSGSIAAASGLSAQGRMSSTALWESSPTEATIPASQRLPPTKKPAWLSTTFLRSRFPGGTWTSLAVVLNPRIGLHRDILNMIGKPNHAIALGSFTGGRIWVEDDDGTSPEVRVTKRNTQQLWGSWIDMHDEPVSFDARRFHKVEPHEGRMWAIAAYTPQAFACCSSENRDAATALGFPVG